jgi:hypothetical protein
MTDPGHIPEQNSEDGPSAALLESPLESKLINRLFVFGGPAGLLAALLAGLWVAQLHVRHSVIAQVDETWVPGRQLAVRSQLLDRDQHGIEGVNVSLSVETQDGVRHELVELEGVSRGGVAQGVFKVPDLPLGPATLSFRYTAPSITSLEESVKITVGNEREKRKPTYTISASTLQHGDDTDAQPEGIRIAARPAGRLIAGFGNRVLVRVTEVNGRPWAGPVEIVLLHGEYMGERGARDTPPQLVLGSTDSLGLIGLEGPLASEVLRLEVRVLDREDSHTRYKRRFRFVSYAGAVQVDVQPLAVSGSDAAEIHARGLSAKRPVFVDVYDNSGAWIDTFRPPVAGAESPREWVHPGLNPGLVQFEAYHFTNAPGESAAMARLQVVEGDVLARPGLEHLLDLQLEQLTLPRIERDYDEAHEREYLKAMASAELTRQELTVARAWLLDTLPVTIYGPPTALNTRPREDASLVERKLIWKMALRWFLLGGGALFLLAMVIAMSAAHASSARKTLVELDNISDEERALLESHVRGARRGALVRGMGVIVVMAGGLVLTVLMLETLL